MNNTKTSTQKSINSNYIVNKKLLEDTINIEETQIRIGVSIADEEAKKESARRRINAPLTIEERILHLSL